MRAALLAARLAFAVVALAAGVVGACGPPKPIVPDRPVGVAEQKAPAPPESDATSTAEPGPDTTAPTALPRYAGGRFEPVVRYADLAPGSDCAHVMPGFGQLLATKRGAWIFGDCGVRVRHVDGKLESFSQPAQAKSLWPSAACKSYPVHWSAWARAGGEAFVLAAPRCGPDPNAVWASELLRFDGSRWVLVPLPPRDPHDADLLHLAGADGTLWGILEGDGWHGPPDNAIVRIAGGKLHEVKSGLGAEVRQMLVQARTPDGGAKLPNIVPYDDYQGIAATASGELWVVGALRQFVGQNDEGSGEPMRYVSGAVWHYSRGRWREHRLDDRFLRAVAVAPDGTVFAAGDGLWRQRPGEPFRALARGWGTDAVGYGASSVAAPAADDVWSALACERSDCRGPVALHFDGARLTRAEVSWPPDAPAEGRGARRARIATTAGGPVWLLDDHTVWRLDPR